MKNITEFISIFMSAVSHCLLYSKDHTAVHELVTKTFSTLNNIFDELGTFEIIIIENDLVVNKNPVREIGLQGQNLIRRLKRKGISHIHFLKGLTLAELKNLIADLSTTEKGLKSSSHIMVGIVDVNIGSPKSLQSVGFLKDSFSDIHKSLSAFSTEQIEKAKDEAGFLLLNSSILRVLKK
jgi:hypothetical protein